MDVLDTEDLDCIAYVDEKTNTVIIKFFGIPNPESAKLFTNYVMITLGIDYKELNNVNSSKMIH
jgi:hypothetical protein